jgi:hypothetical protein
MAVFLRASWTTLYDKWVDFSIPIMNFTVILIKHSSGTCQYMMFSLYDITKLVVGPSRKSLMVLLRTGWSCDAFIFNIFKRKLWFAYFQYFHIVSPILSPICQHVHWPVGQILVHWIMCMSSVLVIKVFAFILNYVYYICPSN